jgi:hypothetical protein
MGALIRIVLLLNIVMAGQAAFAQSAQQNDLAKPNAVQPEERQTAAEVQRFYQRYFTEICQKENRCDGSCKEVFDLLDNKETLKLRCP